MGEVTTSDSDGYFYRMTGEAPNNILYSWGCPNMSWIYSARLEYLGRGRYRLSNRLRNGVYYGEPIKFTRRDRRRTKAYNTTIEMIIRMMEK